MPEPLASQHSTAITSYSEWGDLNSIKDADTSYETTLTGTTQSSETTAPTASGSNNGPSSSTSKRKERDITPPLEQPTRPRTSSDSPVKTAAATEASARPRGAWASPTDNINTRKDLTRRKLITVRRLGFGIQYTLAQVYLSEDKVTTLLILERLPLLQETHEAIDPHVRDLVINGEADTLRLRGREKELSAFVIFLPQWYTDGCGLITLGGTKALYNLGFWNKMPTAIQIRILGAKGLLILDLHRRDSDEPIVRLRPSQIKIKFPVDFPIEEPAHLTIDVLPASHMECGVKLSREQLTNLAENKAPPEVIMNIMTNQLKKAIDDLLAWHSVLWTGEPSDAMDRAMRLLWVAVERSGGVLAARDARENPGTARVRGLRAYDREEEESDDEDDDEGDLVTRQQRSTAWFPDEVSGCPSSLEETVMTFIDRGFQPRANPIMAQKLHEVVQKTIRSFSIKFRLSVPMSCSAFCVPGALVLRSMAGWY
ncbi:unnamed protein product [Peniophora sp. CBMAI 1063]|nr:unnamed protein product [Peniophora sp. CBMAI 1063]